jgi:hypothetical protein
VVIDPANPYIMGPHSSVLQQKCHSTKLRSGHWAPQR